MRRKLLVIRRLLYDFQRCHASETILETYADYAVRGGAGVGVVHVNPPPLVIRVTLGQKKLPETIILPIKHHRFKGKTVLMLARLDMPLPLAKLKSPGFMGYH